MIDIGSREEGITLVNSTAVLVLSYTLGGVLAGVAVKAINTKKIKKSKLAKGLKKMKQKMKDAQ